MKRKRARAAAIWAVAIVLFGRAAHAAPITYEFAGTIDLTVLGDAFGTLSTGDAFQGVFTYDDATVVAPPFVPLGTAYNALTSFSMTIGGETLTGGAGAMVIHNDEGGIDFIEILPFITFPAGSMNPPGTFGGLGICGGCFSIFLRDSTATAFDDESLPGSLSLASFPPPGNNVVRFTDAGGLLSVESQLTSLVPVPEPSAILLLSTGSVRAGPRQTSLRLMRVAAWTSRAMIEQAVHPRPGHDGSDRLDSGAEVRLARPVGERQLHDCGDARRFIGPVAQRRDDHRDLVADLDHVVPVARPMHVVRAVALELDLPGAFLVADRQDQPHVRIDRLELLDDTGDRCGLREVELDSRVMGGDRRAQCDAQRQGREETESFHDVDSIH